MQTIKSSVPFFTVVLETFWLRVDQKDSRIFQSLVPIVGGVILATWTEVEFEMIGFLAALFASLTSAFLSILTSKLLQTKLDSINLLYYMSPISTIVLFPISGVIEGSDIIIQFIQRVDLITLIIILLLSGMIAFSLNIFTFLLINNTSALTYTVVGNVKVVFSIIFSVMIFGNQVTIFNGIGCTITIIGAAWYQKIKYDLKNANSDQK